MNEEALMLGLSRNIVSILTTIANKQHDKTAVLLMNAGYIHRVGPSRIYVKLARTLAKEGLDVLRFDYSGIGDTTVRLDSMPILVVAIQEPREIMDDLGKRGYKNFILMGICSGAYCSFQTACQDQRVIGAVLINPKDFVGVKNLQDTVQARRYFTKSIKSPRSWFNLLKGQTDYKRLYSALMQEVIGFFSGRSKMIAEDTDVAKREVIKLAKRVRMLFVFSEEDPSIEQLNFVMGKDIVQGQEDKAIQIVEFSGADHLFTRLSDQQKVIDVILEWSLSLVKDCNV